MASVKAPALRRAALYAIAFIVLIVAVAWYLQPFDDIRREDSRTGAHGLPHRCRPERVAPTAVAGSAVPCGQMMEVS